MSWPQITVIAWGAAALGIALAKHGEPRENHSFWVTGVSLAIEFFVLYKGGFFGGLA